MFSLYCVRYPRIKVLLDDLVPGRVFSYIIKGKKVSDNFGVLINMQNIDNHLRIQTSQNAIDQLTLKN